MLCVTPAAAMQNSGSIARMEGSFSQITGKGLRPAMCQVGECAGCASTRHGSAKLEVTNNSHGRRREVRLDVSLEAGRCHRHC
jgi:hypothetical protein